MLESLTSEVPVSPIAVDVLRFLGALNIGYVLVAGAGAYGATSAVGASAALGLANGSQFVLDLYAHRSGRWKQRLKGITVLDGLFMLVHGVYLTYAAR
ncbi:hypothetical protein [Hymenobacter terricola]|uniref:hypothetical protein n=1 Tax=Hymenobacter terricola TaxID=2819236 RepID=UPI001B301BA2|nr:hypothetical protein [Hymenobacter terricola]